MTPLEFCQAMKVPVRDETEAEEFWASVDGVLMAGEWLERRRQLVAYQKAQAAYQWCNTVLDRTA
jgi:hypothetical protein